MMRKYGIDRINKHVLQRVTQQRVNAERQHAERTLATAESYREAGNRALNSARTIERENANATIIVRCVPDLRGVRGDRYQFVFTMDVEALRYRIRDVCGYQPVSVGRVVYDAFRKAESEFAAIAMKAVEGTL